MNAKSKKKCPQKPKERLFKAKFEEKQQKNG